ncbi:MAG TPA: HEAT repeat domain-containing protein [Gemmataceae bacterium]|jgi:hypothetical protein
MTDHLRSRLLLTVGVWFLAAAQIPAAGVPAEMINRAVERGVAALRKLQAADGHFGSTGYGSGPTSLAALALLECGVKPGDEQVQNAVTYVREDCPTLNRVYQLALAIMLLDRLADPLDEPLIQELAVRLLEGQTKTGGWTYTTPNVSAEDAERVKALLRRRVELKTTPDAAKPTDRPPLDPALVERLRRLEQTDAPRPDSNPDNSNTQFGVLAVWVARRHGIPCDLALRRCEAYFRATHTNGMWPYMPPSGPDDRVANTCAGLLGLAIGTGVVRDRQLRTKAEGKDGKPPVLRDPMKDPVVQMAMNYVGGQVRELAATGLYAEVNRNRSLYFLWSVERVGMVYSVPVMGGVDWYQAGAATILRAQRPDGMWGGRVPGSVSIPDDVNTCFALLFLRKSNFASDLTSNLRIRPNQTNLHADPESTPADLRADAGTSQSTLRSDTAKGDKPGKAEPTAADRLAGELPKAAAARQDAILTELRDHKGSEYTDALAHVIPKLSGDVQTKARDYLAERLARMTADTVRAKLKDEDAEVRRAAALACAIKEDKGLVPDLIAVLDDKDAWVVRAAAVALRTLTGQGFGPSASATAEERAKAVAAWKAWWKRQSGR